LNQILSLLDVNQLENKSEIENAKTILSVSVHDTNAHLPRIFGNETDDNNTNETNRYFTPIESKVSVIFCKSNYYFYIIFQIEEDNKSISILSTSTDKNRQICWHLPKKFEPSIELLENQIFRFMNVVCILFLSIH